MDSDQRGLDIAKVATPLVDSTRKKYQTSKYNFGPTFMWKSTERKNFAQPPHQGSTEITDIFKISICVTTTSEHDFVGTIQHNQWPGNKPRM